MAHNRSRDTDSSRGFCPFCATLAPPPGAAANRRGACQGSAQRLSARFIATKTRTGNGRRSGGYFVMLAQRFCRCRSSQGGLVCRWERPAVDAHFEFFVHREFRAAGFHEEGVAVPCSPRMPPRPSYHSTPYSQPTTSTIAPTAYRPDCPVPCPCCEPPRPPKPPVWDVGYVN